jgi:hypothetical protein
VLAEVPDRRWAHALQWLCAFALVCGAWVFFRADSVGTAVAMLGRLVTFAPGSTALVTWRVLLAIGIGLATQFAPREPALRFQAAIANLKPIPMGVAAAFVLFAITTLGPRGVAPFIYFQF